jgi:hypothetical protein
MERRYWPLPIQSGQPVDKIAKVAFIQYINKVLKKAEELEAANKETPSGDGNTVHTP